MGDIRIDLQNAKKFYSTGEYEEIKAKICAARDVLLSKEGEGNDFVGWVDLPKDYDKKEFERILSAAEKIKSDSDVLLVIGIGDRKSVV